MQESTPLEPLQRRYAAREISTAAYDEARRVLEHEAVAPEGNTKEMLSTEPAHHDQLADCHEAPHPN